MWRSLGLIIASAVLGFLLGTMNLDWQNHSRTDLIEDLTVRVDLPEHRLIALTRHDGIKTNWGSTAGRARLVFFGYTFCPDVCPLGLSTISDAIDILKVAGHDVTPIFITVDPTRDTAKVLNDYVSSFHDDLIGFSGEDGDIKQIAEIFKAFFQVTEGYENDEYYLMDHTSFIYFIDKDGRLVDFFNETTPANTIADKVIASMEGSA